MKTSCLSAVVFRGCMQLVCIIAYWVGSMFFAGAAPLSNDLPVAIPGAEMQKIQQTISFEVATNQGSVAMDAERYETAQAWFNRAIVIDPKSSAAFALRGEARVQLRLEDVGANDFEQAVRLDPRNKEAWRRRGSLQLSRQEYNEALTNANKAIALDPKFAMAYNTRAWARFHLGETNGAVDDLITALTISPDLAAAQKSLESVTERNGRAHRIVEICTNLVVLNPSGAVNYYILALGHATISSEWPLGKELLTELIRLEPTNPTRLAQRAYCNIQLGKKEEALADLEAALKINPTDPWVHHYLGTYFEVTGDEQKALAAHTKAIVLDPFLSASYKSIEDIYGHRRDGFVPEMEKAAHENTNSAAIYHYRAGYYLHGFNKLKESAQQFTKAIELKPDYADAVHERGRTYWDLRELDLALKDFEQAIKLDSTAPYSHLNRGGILELKGRTEEAIDEYKLAMRAKPADSQAHNSLRALRAKSWDHELLINDYTELAKVHPEGAASYYYHRGNAKFELARYAAAIADYSAAIEHQPLDYPAILQRSRAKRKSGDLAGGLADAQRVLKELRTSGNAMVECGLNLQQLGRQEEALAMMGRAVRTFPNSSIYRAKRARMQIELEHFDQALADLTYAIGLDGKEEYYYQRASIKLLKGDAVGAASDAREFLQEHGWNSAQSAYAVLQAYEAYTKAGQTGAASNILQQAKAKLAPAGWLTLMIRHLRGEVREEVVMARAVDQNSVSLAHYYLGLEAFHLGRKQDALQHLTWVKDHSHEEFSFERRYAVQQLELIRAIPETAGGLPTTKPIEIKTDTDHGLAVYLPLTEDLLDHSSNRMPVKINGKITIENGAAFFKGGDNFLDLPHVNLGLRPWAVSLWVRFTGNNAMYGIVEQKDSDAPNRYIHMMLRGNAQPQLGFYLNDVISPTSLEMRDSWHHLVFQFTGLHQQIWVDGVLLCQRVSEPYEGVTGATRIGRSPKWKGIPSKNLEGYVKEFRIYERELIHAEIKKLGLDAGKSVVLDGTNKEGSAVVTSAPSSKGSASKAAQEINLMATLPPPKPFLSINGPALVISSPPVQVYDLQATSDLGKEWAHLANLTNTTGQVEFIDPGASISNNRFYRVLVTSSSISSQ